MKPTRPGKKSDGSPLNVTKKPTTYAEVVAQYLANDQARGDLDLAWFAKQPDWDTLLEKAVLSRSRGAKNGKEVRHPHQRRLREPNLRKAHRALGQCDLQACGSFDELHDTIEQSTSEIPGIGPLAVFDFACRIGAWMRPALRPKQVYLHRGARKGAQALGLGQGLKTIRVRELPDEFHGLSGRHAEDCLCIYKEELKEIASRRS